jgi:hypothetical protein
MLDVRDKHRRVSMPESPPQKKIADQWSRAFWRDVMTT